MKERSRRESAGGLAGGARKTTRQKKRGKEGTGGEVEALADIL